MMCGFQMVFGVAGMEYWGMMATDMPADAELDVAKAICPSPCLQAG